MDERKPPAHEPKLSQSNNKDESPKAGVTQSILGLAETLSGERKETAEETVVAKPEKSGLFSFLSSSKTKGK